MMQQRNIRGAKNPSAFFKKSNKLKFYQGVPISPGTGSQLKGDLCISLGQAGSG